MEIDANLLKRCHINKNDDGDRFVGVKADSNDAVVYFPIGYQLPETEQEVRRDILHLISVLAEFTERSDKVLMMKKFEAPQSVDFPINAYMEVINYYMEQNSYYTEKETLYKTSDRGDIDWAKTIKNQKPLIQANGSPVYTDFTVRVPSPNEKNLITKIHKYCVYESFQKLGWLFTPDLPPKPDIEKNTKQFIIVLNDKLARTNNDKDKRLFSAMISLLKYIDEKTDDKRFYFGTDRFEYVWEKLIDRIFGIKDKQSYFPKTKWHLNFGKVKENAALEPDTIMLFNDKIYVLDAKYYRYGITGKPNHLPESTSINKQITYGEYIHTNQQFKDKYGEDVPVYNAFLMPYNSKENIFDLDATFANIGEAKGDWKKDNYAYERVQGIVADIRYLMYHYTGNHKNRILSLATSIESAFDESDGLLPQTTDE